MIIRYLYYVDHKINNKYDIADSMADCMNYMNYLIELLKDNLNYFLGLSVFWLIFIAYNKFKLIDSVRVVLGFISILVITLIIYSVNHFAFGFNDIKLLKLLIGLYVNILSIYLSLNKNKNKLINFESLFSLFYFFMSCILLISYVFEINLFYNLFTLLCLFIYGIGFVFDLGDILILNGEKYIYGIGSREEFIKELYVINNNEENSINSQDVSTSKKGHSKTTSTVSTSNTITSQTDSLSSEAERKIDFYSDQIDQSMEELQDCLKTQSLIKDEIEIKKLALDLENKTKYRGNSPMEEDEEIDPYIGNKHKLSLDLDELNQDLRVQTERENRVRNSIKNIVNDALKDGVEISDEISDEVKKE